MLQQLSSGADIARETDRLLHRAGAYGRFPTPVVDILSAAKLRESSESIFSDTWVSQAPSRIRMAIARVSGKVRALLDRKERVIYLNAESSHPAGNPFKKLHEVTHHILPWQEALAYADDDLTLSFATRVTFEQEANQGAAELLFQRELFAQVAGDYEIAFGSVVELAEKFGASIHSTMRRYIETHREPIAGCVLPSAGFELGSETIRRNEAMASRSWLDRFADPGTWPKHLSILEVPFLHLAIAAHATPCTPVQGSCCWPDATGQIHQLEVECLFNGFNVLILLSPSPRKARLRRKAPVIIPS